MTRAAGYPSDSALKRGEVGAQESSARGEATVRAFGGKIAIRRARRTDGEAVAAMAAALSAHEGKPHGPFTAARFRREGFGRNAAFTTLVARAGRIVGYALFYAGYDVDTASRGVHLVDRFVTASARRSGVGRALVTAVARECIETGGAWIAWFVQRDNREARAFYRALGARPDDDIPLEMRAANFVPPPDRSTKNASPRRR